MSLLGILVLLLAVSPTEHVDLVLTAPGLAQFVVESDSTAIMEQVRHGVVWPGRPLLLATGGEAELTWKALDPPIRLSLPCTSRAALEMPVAAIAGEGFFRANFLTRVLVQPLQQKGKEWLFFPRVQVTLRFPVGPTHPFWGGDPFAERILRPLLVNPDQARLLRKKQNRCSVRSTPPPSPSCKLIVDHQGLYKVTYEQFWAAGVSLREEDPSTFRLWYHGEEQSFRVEDGGDLAFGEGDYIVFYGEQRHREDPQGRDDPYVSHYSREATYWLSWGGDAGLRWTVTDGSPDYENPEAEWFWHLEHTEEENTVIIAFHNEAYNNSLEWFWQHLPASTVLRQFLVPTTEIAVADTFVLRLGIQGASDSPGHHSEFYVEGALVDSAWWGSEAGRDTLLFDSADSALGLPLTLLDEGSTTIGIKELNDGPAGSAAKSYLNWIEILYPRHFVASDSSLGFGAPEGAGGEAYLFKLKGFGDADVAVVNLSSSLWIEGATLSGDSLVFSADVFGSHRLWAQHSSVLDSVQAIVVYEELDPPPDSATRGADYIVVTPQAFSELADSLAEEMESFFGWRTAVVGVQLLYDYFSYGELTPVAIRDFLEAAYENWVSPEPSYVCFLGDACWDFLGHSGPGTAQNLVPTWGNPGNDYFFGRLTSDLQGDYDWMPDIAIGRLPARDTAEARSMIRTSLQYLDSEIVTKRIVFMAHGSSDYENISFAAQSDGLITYAVPSDLLPRIHRIYADLEGADSTRSYKNEFMDVWNNTPLLVHFIGRGDFYTWCMELHNSMADTLTGADLPPFLVGGSCHSGRVALPDSSCLGEMLLRSSSTDGCCSGFISSTGVTSVSSGYLWSRYALPVLLAEEPATAGEAFVAGVLQAGDFISQRFLLLGNPGLVLSRPRDADLSVPDQWLSAEPMAPSEDDPSVNLLLEIANLGSAASDPGEDWCQITVSDSSSAGVTSLGSFSSDVAITGDSLFTIPWEPIPARGSHEIRVEIDVNHEISELDEGNNIARDDVTVLFASPQPFSPEDCALLVTQIPQLSVRSLPSEPDVVYRFQVSADPLFAIPESILVESDVLPAGPYYTVWTPPALPERRALYWRCRAEDHEISGRWAGPRSFFLNRLASGRGWRQSHWGQFVADSLLNCTVDTLSSLIELSKSPGPDVALTDSGATVIDWSSSHPSFSPEALIGSGRFIFGNNDMEQTAVVDLGVSHSLLRVGAEFWAGAMDRGVWSEFEISTSNDGISYEPWITYGPYSEPNVEIPPCVYAEVDDPVSARYIRACFGAGCPQTSGVYWGSRIYEIFAQPVTVPPEGEFRSSSIGPSLWWHELSVEATESEPGDSVFVSIWGFSTQSSAWEAIGGFQDLSGSGQWNLSGIDPSQYPWIRLQGKLLPSSTRGDPGLQSWEVRYDPR